MGLWWRKYGLKSPASKDLPRVELFRKGESEIKLKAVELRKAGNTFKEIGEILSISTSTVAFWWNQYGPPSASDYVSRTELYRRREAELKSKAIELHQAGNSFSKIGKILSVSWKTVNSWWNKYGPKSAEPHFVNPHRKREKEIKLKAVELHQAGKTFREIAEILSVRRTTVGLWWRKYGPTPAEDPLANIYQRGETAAKRKVVELRQSGKSFEEIAEILSIKKRTVILWWHKHGLKTHAVSQLSKSPNRGLKTARGPSSRAKVSRPSANH